MRKSPFTLSWTHYVTLLTIKDPDERSFYEIEATNQGWSVPELKRQKASALYERLALSRDKEGIRKLAAEGHVVARPEDVLREPYVLEFLGIEEKSSYSESDLETAIINHLEHFLLELGKGFLFEARQKRFTFDEDHFFVDLVFYNRLLRCYVIIDLKLEKLTHQDLGQIQMYVNYFDRHVKLPDENPTVGLLLCKSKKDAIVNAEGPELLRAFWHTIAGRLPEKSSEKMEPGITILDPTCGSGAFLFAALRILETLYSDCLERMERFIEDVEHAAPSTPEEQVRTLIAAGESATVEFKASARWDTKENRHNPVLEGVIVKTVAGFLNGHGGTLLIGISDNGVVLGLERDYRHTRKKNPSRDQFELWLTNHLMKKLGHEAKPCFHIDFAECDGEDVCRVRVYRSAKPVFAEKNGQEVLYVRQGNATNPYTKSSQILVYKEQHWPADRPVPPPPPPLSADGAAPVKRAANAKRVYDDFRQTLAVLDKHPSDSYFILKTIIINNLFGVDIMEEAVEICQLRLFLKLAAQVETFDQIEPLPDIDFNIRAGNSLVGFASLDQVKQSMEGDWVRLQSLPRIEEDAELVDRAFQQFRAQQTTYGGKVTAKDKHELRKRLAKLDDELDHYSAGEYGVNVEKQKDFDAWKASHEPFHWFVEFYGIMNGGGFDVIIGNPPWKEYSAVKKTYKVRGYAAESSGNLYGLCSERSATLVSPHGFLSFIVQLPIVSSSRMRALRDFLLGCGSFVTTMTCDDRPGKLFDGLQHCRSTIFLLQRRGDSEQTRLWSSGYRRWSTDARKNLFTSTAYSETCDNQVRQSQFPKLASALQVSAYEKVFRRDNPQLALTTSDRPSKSFVFYQESAQYWVKATIGLPHYSKDGEIGAPAHGRHLYFQDARTTRIACAILNSSLFYTYFIAYGDCFHVSDTLATSMPVPPAAFQDDVLADLGVKLMQDLRCNAERKTINTKNGSRIAYDEFRVGGSKPIIDEIDRTLAKHYGFTAEELDFIINYDIKYRMGGANVDAAEDD